MTCDEERIRYLILKKLYNSRRWGKGHMLVKRLKSIVPSHLRGEVFQIIKDLVKEWLIVVYGRTKHGLAVHLNIAKKREIEEILFENQNV